MEKGKREDRDEKDRYIEGGESKRWRARGRGQETFEVHEQKQVA